MPIGDLRSATDRLLSDLHSNKIDIDPFKPQNLEDYVGQAKAKRVVSIIVQAALKDRHALPSTLITGPYGQGKTSLARIMADLYDPSIPMLDAASVNKNPLEKGTFIVDEIHNLAPDVCDSLNIRMDNRDIYIIGCSTNPGALPTAFRSRFRQVYLEPYLVSDIARIIKNALSRKRFTIESKALNDIAKRSRLNPRMALNYLAFIIDLAIIQNVSYIGTAFTKRALAELNVNNQGLLLRDLVYLNALPTDGRSVGLQYLSARTSIDERTIETEIEPYLLQLGLIDRTSKGRKLLATNPATR